MSFFLWCFKARFYEGKKGNGWEYFLRVNDTWPVPILAPPFRSENGPNVPTVLFRNGIKNGSMLTFLFAF